MIFWCILLSVLLSLSITFNIYTFLKGKQNTDAILKIIGPDIDLIKKDIKKIKASL